MTGKLREGDNVNHRVQDGEKVYLLCSVCEGKFSKLETAASRAFDAGTVVHGSAYSLEFVLFLTSIVWRISVVRTAEFRAAHDRFAPNFDEALQTWKDVLDGKRGDFDGHPVWFVLLDTDLARSVYHYLLSNSTNDKGAAPVIHRYFANYIGTEVSVYEREGYALIWGKTGSWLIIGVIAAPTDPAAVLVELYLPGGTFPAAGSRVPDVILASLGYQAAQYLKMASEMRPEQRAKVKDEWTKNSAKVAGSDQARAMQDDIAMFGDDAFVNVPEPEE